MLRKEVERVRRDLWNAEHRPRFSDNGPIAVWETSARNALERVERDLTHVEGWLAQHDRDLLEKATKLLESLADDGTDLSSSEYELIKRLVDRQKNP